MSIKLRKKKKAERFYPEGEDRDDPEATCFVMKKLKEREKAKVEDNLIKLDENGQPTKVQQNTVDIDMVLEKMKGWENLYDEEGNEIEFDEEKKEEVFEGLPDEVRDELLNKFGLNA